VSLGAASVVGLIGALHGVLDPRKGCTQQTRRNPGTEVQRVNATAWAASRAT
jgi:hypothetical protein